MSKFFKNIINPKNEVSKIFESLCENVIGIDWNMIQEEFHNSIEEYYPSIRCRINLEVAEERNPIPPRLVSRIKVTTLLLAYLVAGKKYSRELYLNTLEFCATVDLNKGNYLYSI
jgi:hypothetical protein